VRLAKVENSTDPFRYLYALVSGSSICPATWP
jgi:hypothetical protein